MRSKPESFRPSGVMVEYFRAAGYILQSHTPNDKETPDDRAACGRNQDIPRAYYTPPDKATPACRDSTTKHGVDHPTQT